MSDDGNIFQFGTIPGGKSDKEDDAGFPQNSYVVYDVDGEEWYASGFLIFTPHHLAIMQDTGAKGAVPVLVLPIGRVRAAEAVEPEYEEDEPQLFDGA